MANIQPYEYQKRTNIEEHNDLVSKINEIIDVINQTNIETILPKINKLEADVSAINDTDNVQNTDIANLKEKDIQIDNRLVNNENNINGITKSLVSDVILMNGTTTGNMKARIERQDAPSIDSNDYNIQKPVSVELVQGSASAMVKAKITLSDGTILISDDFMFTTEAIGTDVYISSFVFKNGNVAGTISADIGLSNGSTLEANNFVVPTDPNVISTISDIQNRLTAVESGAGGLTELKATVDGHTTSINELNTDVASLKTDKADVNNSNQTIVAGTVNATNINKGSVAVATVNDIPDISGKVNIVQGTENAGKVLGIGVDGNVTPVDGGSGGEVWEEVDLNNFPTNWGNKDRIKVSFYDMFSQPGSGNWNTTPEMPQLNSSPTNPLGIVELILFGSNQDNIIIAVKASGYNIGTVSISLSGASEMNSNSVFSVYARSFNSGGVSSNALNITRSNISQYIFKMWRLKQEGIIPAPPQTSG